MFSVKMIFSRLFEQHVGSKVVCSFSSNDWKFFFSVHCEKIIKPKNGKSMPKQENVNGSVRIKSLLLPFLVHQSFVPMNDK